MQDNKVRAFFIQLGSNIDRKKGYDGLVDADARKQVFCACQ